MQPVNHRAHKLLQWVTRSLGMIFGPAHSWLEHHWACLGRHLAVFTAVFLFVPFPMGELLLGLTFWDKQRRGQNAFALLKFKHLNLCFSICKRQSTCVNEKTMCSPFSWSLGVRPHGPCPIQEDCLWPWGSGDHWHPRQNSFQKALHLWCPQTETDTGGEAQHPFCHQKVGGKKSKRKCMAQGCQGFEQCSLHAHRVCFDMKNSLHPLS